MVDNMNYFKKMKLRRFLILMFTILLIFAVLNFINLKNKLKKITNVINLQSEEIQEAKHLKKDLLLYSELYIKNSLSDLPIESIKNNDSDNNILQNKFKLNKGFYFGIHNIFPGSGYIDIYNDKLILLSSRGILAYNNKNLTNSFKQIENNIDDFINEKQFIKDEWFSIKDLAIIDDKIFISYTEEFKPDCWNTSIIYSSFNLKKIKFKKFFSSKNCVNSSVNKTKNEQFNGHQAGGRIRKIDNNNILFSVGEYRRWELAQNINFINGKLLSINLNNSEYKIISMGHRNPEGIYFDQEENYIIETEHGPNGGDEINLINLNNDLIPNYGWPIASYGQHYFKKFDKFYPLVKNHKKKGFIEPIKFFDPSIGISEIVKIDKKKYIASSMKDKSLYIFNLNKDNKIYKLKEIYIGERIRDLIFDDKKIYLFLENTASIGVIPIEKLDI